MLFPFEVSTDDRKEFLYSDKYSLSSTSNDRNEDETRKFLCAFSFRTQWTVWRVVSAFMGVFFLAAAYVQHNDPDPYLWMVTYMVPCLVSWVVSLGVTLKTYKKLPSESPQVAPKIQLQHHVKNIKNPKINNTPSKNQDGSNYENPVEKIEASVMIPMYGQANQKLNWIINLHIIYCFTLGLWTLLNYAYEFRSYYYPLDSSSDSYIGFYGKNPKIFSMNQGSKNWHDSTEEAKELMGLCLVIAWLSLLRHNNYVVLSKLGLTIGISLTIIPIVSWILIEIFQEEGESQCH